MRFSKNATCSSVGLLTNPKPEVVGISPLPDQTSRPDRLASPPRAETRITPSMGLVRHGPSRRQVPAVPLAKFFSTWRPLRVSENLVESVSSQTYRQTW